MRKVSMLDVARAAGVSKNTVSLALRHSPQIPPATRERIAQVAAKLGYTRNPTVDSLMAQLRASAATGHKATLALINANEEREAFRKHPTIPHYVEGCRRAAARQGYSLDEFWLHDPELDGARLLRILHARRIRGAVIAGLMRNNQLPARFAALWQTLPCVVTGVRTREPALSFCSTDHHILARRAFEKALELGYRRPGLVLDEVIDELVEGRFTAGVLTAQQALPAARRVPPFGQGGEGSSGRVLFHRWREKHRPDVILTLYHTVHRWLKEAGVRVPEELGLIQLEWRPDHAHWAGMDQHNREVGEAAVEMVIGMLHNNETGVPLFPRATLIGSTWVDGETVLRC